MLSCWQALFLTGWQITPPAFRQCRQQPDRTADCRDARPATCSVGRSRSWLIPTTSNKLASQANCRLDGSSLMCAALQNVGRSTARPACHSMRLLACLLTCWPASMSCQKPLRPSSHHKQVASSANPWQVCPSFNSVKATDALEADTGGKSWTNRARWVRGFDTGK